LPTFKVDLDLLSRVVGKKLDSPEVNDLIFCYKGDIESIEGRSLVVDLNTDRPDLMCSAGLGRAFRGMLEEGMHEVEQAPLCREDAVSVDCNQMREINSYFSCYLVDSLSLDLRTLNDILDYQSRLHVLLSRAKKKFHIGLHDISNLHDLHLFYKLIPVRDIRFKPRKRDKEMSGEEILREIFSGDSSYPFSSLNSYPLLLSSSNEVLSMLLVTEGSLTEISENTKSIMVEVTGSEPSLVLAIAQMVALNISEYGSPPCRIALTQEYMADTASRTESVTSELVKSLLGIDIDHAEIIRLLAKSGLKARMDKNSVVVAIPSHRIDILHPVDLVEDIAMMKGYDSIPPRIPSHSTVGGLQPSSLIQRAARNCLSTLGLAEVNNMMMFSKSEMGYYYAKEPVSILNPVSEELNTLRTCIFPQLLDFLRQNQGKPKPIRIFEVGPVAYVEDELYVQSIHAAALLSDNVASSDTLESYLNRFCNDMAIQQTYANEDYHFMIHGRSAAIYVKGNRIGFIGEMDPEVLLRNKIDYPVAFFEVSLVNTKF
jgi:phenylalanyl-tRNA synthetase beta chain